MTQADKLLTRMRNNPRGDWQIGDVERIAAAHGLQWRQPAGGSSHVTLSHPSRPDILTIPAARPIKPVYIAKLVAFVDSVIGAAQ